MKPMRNLALAVLAGLALPLAPAGAGEGGAPAADGLFAVTHVRVFDGLRVLHDATVAVRNGRIGAVAGTSTCRPTHLPPVKTCNDRKKRREPYEDRMSAFDARIAHLRSQRRDGRLPRRS